MDLVVLTGYSGSGKTELGKRLETIGYVKAVSNTTRDPREGEIDGIDYHFKKNSKDFFASNLIEYAEYPKNSGKFYGLSADEMHSLADILSRKEISLVCDEFSGVVSCDNFSANLKSANFYGEFFNTTIKLTAVNLIAASDEESGGL